MLAQTRTILCTRVANLDPRSQKPTFYNGRWSVVCSEVLSAARKITASRLSRQSIAEMIQIKHCYCFWPQK